MGKLRIEPKVKPLLDEKEYKYYREVLKKAEKASSDNNVYWDLEPDEKAVWARKALLYVAGKEGLNLKIRAKRGSNSLTLNFAHPRSASGGRVPAAECKQRIVDALKAAAESLQKSDIISRSGISASTWNLRIRELLQDGTVVRKGKGRLSRYSLREKR
jgi:hypothetical protein